MEKRKTPLVEIDRVAFINPRNSDEERRLAYLLESDPQYVESVNQYLSHARDCKSPFAQCRRCSSVAFYLRNRLVTAELPYSRCVECTADVTDSGVLMTDGTRLCDACAARTIEESTNG